MKPRQPTKRIADCRLQIELTLIGNLKSKIYNLQLEGCQLRQRKLVDEVRPTKEPSRWRVGAFCLLWGMAWI
jgi:hypothetical protein